MKLTIPSTTVKSRFLKTLPVGTIYRDPRNGHAYIIEEKKINECLSKAGMPYIGSGSPIEVHVPDKYMKMDNPRRANIMGVMKEKTAHLESLVKEPQSKLDAQSRYGQIKELMGDRKYLETERDVYCVGDEGVVYQMRITKSKEETHESLEKYMASVWKDAHSVSKLMEKQDKIQSKLLQILNQGK